MPAKLNPSRHLSRALLATLGSPPRPRPRPLGWRSPIEDQWPLNVALPLPWSCGREEPLGLPVGRGITLRRFPC